MLGYYAHYHGSGHANYANIMSKVFGKNMKIYTSSDYDFHAFADVLKLPDEDLDGTEAALSVFPTPGYLHYAPVGLEKITRRNWLMLCSFLADDIKLLIIDVSVEVAALARVSSMPYVYVKMMGQRNDAPHLYAYEGAAFLIAYYPEAMEAPATPDWVKEKTLYFGFFSRYSLQRLTEYIPTMSNKPPVPEICLVKGFGGKDVSEADLSTLNRQFPQHNIIIVGPVAQKVIMANVHYRGVVSDIAPYVLAADLVVVHCGANTIAEMATLNARCLLMPEERPYQEQEAMADALKHLKLAFLFSEYDNTNPSDALDSWSPYVCNNAVDIFKTWLEENAYHIGKLQADVKKFQDLGALQENYQFQNS